MFPFGRTGTGGSSLMLPPPHCSGGQHSGQERKYSCFHVVVNCVDVTDVQFSPTRKANRPLPKARAAHKRIKRLFFSGGTDGEPVGAVVVVQRVDVTAAEVQEAGVGLAGF